MVDDSTIYLEMMAVMIGEEYNLKFATSGEKALRMLKSEKNISLILLDLIMPYMSGAEFLDEIKKDPELKDIPVVVLASSDDNEAACLSLGAVDYIRKPFPVRSAVLAKIENALSNNQNSKGIDFDSYVNALFAEYQTVYLIDVKDGSYESITEDENFSALGLEPSGSDFFAKFRSDAEKVVYKDDLEQMLGAFDKYTFMTAVQSLQGMAMNYRICLSGEVMHYRLKAMYIPDENPQVIIGITCTEEEVVGMEALNAFRDDPRNYASVAQSLASDYMCIYFVHLESNRFIEYYSVPEFERLRLEKSGENFFTFGLKSFLEGVNSVDTERVTRTFTKENVLKTIDEHRAFTIAFRLTFEESDEYVSLKATKMTKDGVDYLVVGISNIDAQINEK